MRKIWWLLAVLAVAAPVATAPRAEAQNQVPQLQPNDHVLGKPDAPGIIFEYASLTCPHCARFETEMLPKIKALWIDTGKAKLIFRDYPLDQSALRAAELTRCAPPDRYFVFLDVLFKNQAGWATSANVKEALSRIARIGGISEDRFNACMTDEKLADSIVGERLQAEQQYGIESTPTFFVNGQKLVGEQSLEQIAAALGEKLPSGTPDAAAAPGAASPAPAPTDTKPADTKPSDGKSAPKGPYSMLERLDPGAADLFHRS